MLLAGQEQFRQRLQAQGIEDEAPNNQSGNDGGRVQNAAQPFPSLTLRIEKYLLIEHWFESVSTCAKTAETVYAIQYESYGSQPFESIESPRIRPWPQPRPRSGRPAFHRLPRPGPLCRRAAPYLDAAEVF